jgi:hypothetical protein
MAAQDTTRSPLTLDKRVKNTIADSRIVKSTRGPQEHILEAGKTHTVCNTDTAAWKSGLVEVASKSTNCPVCARVLKERKGK